MKKHITTAEVTDIADPVLRKIAKRVVNEMDLTIAKVVAHDAQPAKYPLPSDPDSIEQILWQYYQTKTVPQRSFAAARLTPMIEGTSARSKRMLGDLAAVDLESAVPIAEQVSKLPYPADLRISAAAMERLAESYDQAAEVGEGGLMAQQTTDRLELRIHRVTCVDETNTVGTEVRIGRHRACRCGAR